MVWLKKENKLFIAVLQMAMVLNAQFLTVRFSRNRLILLFSISINLNVGGLYAVKRL